MKLIFHMARKAEWDAAQAAGFYQGAAEDRVDGFIHFSTAVQVKESAAKHRTSEANLILVAGYKDEVRLTCPVLCSAFLYLDCGREMNEPVDPILRCSLIETSRLRRVPFGFSGHVKYQFHARTLAECD